MCRDASIPGYENMTWTALFQSGGKEGFHEQICVPPAHVLLFDSKARACGCVCVCARVCAGARSRVCVCLHARVRMSVTVHARFARVGVGARVCV